MREERERGQCIAKLPHECGTKQGLVVFQKDSGTIDGYCFSCDTVVNDPLEGKKPPKPPPKKTQEEIDAELESISKLPSHDIKERKLRKSSLEYFGVKVGLSEQDGKTPAFMYFPYTKDGKVVGYKVKHLPTKKTWSVGNQRDVDLFGWRQALESGSKRLICVEGEADCIALHRILDLYTKGEYRSNMPSIVSIPHGAGSASRDISRLLKEIKKSFKHISLCFDNDEAGESATREVSKLLPNATTIKLPCKDANDCLIKGMAKAAYKAVTFNTEEVKKSRLVFGNQVHQDARKVAEYGELSWPWESLNKVTKGIRFGETIYMAAGVKMGKSEMVNTLAAHFIREGNKVLLAKPEEETVNTYKLLCGKVAGKCFHNPDIEFDFEAYDKAGEVVKDYVAMVDIYQSMDWSSLKLDIDEAVEWGAKVVILDPITCLSNGINASEANTLLQEVSQEVAAIAKDKNIAIFIFAHLNNPVTGPSHQEGGRVLTSQFAGSRAMARSCHMMFGLEGNKSPDLPTEERNLRTLVLLEERSFGGTARIKLMWDWKTGLFSEVED